MEALNNFRNLKVYDSTMFHLEDVKESYAKYIEKIGKLSETEQKRFLEVLKDREVIDMQKSENENELALEMERKRHRKDSIMQAAKIATSSNDFNLETLKELHKLVIRGTADDIPKNYDYRDYEVRVSEYENGIEKIQYMPPLPKEIEAYMLEVLDFINENNTTFDNVFLKPVMIHALISILQPFGNGNTRLARLIQHVKILGGTNLEFGTNFEKPLIYMSPNYVLTQFSYRGGISNIARNADDEAWNKWFNYNLNMIEEQLYYVTNGVDRIMGRRF